MNIRTLLFSICLAVFAGEIQAQDYSVIYTNPNSVGQPGQLFLSQVKVQNNSNEGIFMHFERIVNNLPGAWTSCFCYPQCCAPWIDSLTFSVDGFSTDSIMPNFGTDSIPAMATVTIVLYQLGYENMADTITFTGSTLPAGIVPHANRRGLSVYPNPFSDYLTTNNGSNSGVSLVISSSLGETVYTDELVEPEERMDLSFLLPGTYFMHVRTEAGEVLTTVVVKFR